MQIKIFSLNDWKIYFTIESIWWTSKLKLFSFFLPEDLTIFLFHHFRITENELVTIWQNYNSFDTYLSSTSWSNFNRFNNSKLSFVRFAETPANENWRIRAGSWSRFLVSISSSEGETRFSLGDFERDLNERKTSAPLFEISVTVSSPSKRQRTAAVENYIDETSKRARRPTHTVDERYTHGSADGIYNSRVHVAYICEATGVLPSKRRRVSFSNSSPGDFNQPPGRPSTSARVLNYYHPVRVAIREIELRPFERVARQRKVVRSRFAEESFSFLFSFFSFLSSFRFTLL